jgi:hypothetical protein
MLNYLHGAVESSFVAGNIFTVSLYCCYKENNSHSSRQTGRYIYGMNSSFVHVHVACVCVWVLFLYIYTFILSFFLAL